MSSLWYSGEKAPGLGSMGYTGPTGFIFGGGIARLLRGAWWVLRH